MAASAIIISFDSSDESVGSPPSQIPPDEMTSPEHISPLPAFHQRQIALSISSDRNTTADPYLLSLLVKEQGNRRPSSLHDFPICCLFTAPPGFVDGCSGLLYPRQGRPILLGTDLTAPILTGRIITHLFEFTSILVHSFFRVWMRRSAYSRSSTRDVSPRLCYPPRREPRCSEAVRRSCAAPFITWYPPTTSRVDHQEIHQEYPIHLSSILLERISVSECRSPVDSAPLSMPVTGSLAPTRADLSPPRKRFRDSYSSEASIEEDAEGMPRDTQRSMKADASLEISAERDGIVRKVEDTPVDLGNAVRNFYHHMSEVCVDRIVRIETAQAVGRPIS
ncbi:hypothetical protein Tco_1501665 [Tanacetum coccineum]